MNIAVLCHRLPFPPIKGEKIRTYNQLEYFREAGCNVTVFCTVDSAQERDHAREYQQKTGFTVITVNAGYRKLAMFLGLLRARPLSVSYFYNRALQKHFDDYMTENATGAVYCTSSAMAEYVFRAVPSARKRDNKRRDIIDFMDLDSDKWGQYRKISGLPMSLVYRYEELTLTCYERKIQRRFDVCVFISDNETALFAKQLGHAAANLAVIGNGVDVSAFQPPEHPRKPGSKKLLFSGVMDYLPNENAMVWFVEHVWPELVRVHPEIRLVIAGMNPSQAILDLARDERITVTGYIDDMLACYHQASIFIAPFQIARGVQNKILQAFACGLPVVTSSIGAEGINCIDGKHYLQATDPEQYIEQIGRLIDDHSCYSLISAEALALVRERFTWDASNQELFKLFRVPGKNRLV